MAQSGELMALPKPIIDFLRSKKYTDPVVIGMGQYGRVVRATYTATGGQKLKCAIKVIIRKKDDGTQEKLFNRERTTMALARHRSVVQLYEHFRIPSAFFISMELCGGGNLHEYITNLAPNSYPPHPLTLSWCKDLLSALHYIHDYLEIAHRDLKPENVLFDSSLRLKLADFGYAKQSPGDHNTVCGSPLFMPPELIRSPGPNHDPYMCDVWGWGLLAFLMFTKGLPFSPNSLSGTADLDITPKLDREFARGRVPIIMYGSIKEALQAVPTDRPTLCAIRSQAWYNQVQSPPPNPPTQQQQQQQQKGQTKKK